MHDKETRKWGNKEQVAVRGSATHNAAEVSENGPTIQTQMAGNGAKCKRRNSENSIRGCRKDSWTGCSETQRDGGLHPVPGSVAQEN
jgi:hypothetical protein